MKKAIFSLLTLLLAVSCSPLVYTLYLDARKPSQSGLDLSRKSMAIVCMESKDSVFDRTSASAMARVLEQDYFGGEELVGMYRIPAADSVSLDLMHSLIMDTGADVVFLLGSKLGEPVLGTSTDVRNSVSVDSAYVCPVDVPINTYLKVYDSMGSDEIHSYKGNAIMHPLVYHNGMASGDGIRTLVPLSLTKEAEKVGSRVASRFLSKWETEGFSLYYFDDTRSYTWEKALRYAYDREFTKAVDIWTGFSQSGSKVSRAAACYNIAMAFYLMDDYAMATRWLDMADATENLSLSPGLRKRINSKK